MKILVVDDNPKNLDAAREASKEFPAHEFQFVSLASVALKMLPEVDGVITDFFLEPEDDEELNKMYAEYIEKANTINLSDCNSEKKHNETAIHVLKNGNIVSKLSEEELTRRDEWMKGEGGCYLERYESRCGYGGVIMLRQLGRFKRCVLVSQLHSHASWGTDNEHSVWAWYVLSPLTRPYRSGNDEGPLSRKDIEEDGLHGLHYIGENSMPGGFGGKGKTNPVTWVRAIAKLIAQGYK